MMLCNSQVKIMERLRHLYTNMHKTKKVNLILNPLESYALLD